MLKFSERTDSWNQMLLAPKKTAAQHAKIDDLDFDEGLENFSMPILLVYSPLVLFALLLSGNLEPVYLATILFSLAATTLGIFVVSIVFTFLAYELASFLGGKAKLDRLYYMISLAAAPTFVFTIVINIAVILFQFILEAISSPLAAISILRIAGNVVAVSVTIYGFYLLTIAIDSLYKFGKKKAIAVWLVPTVVIAISGFLLFNAIFNSVLGFLAQTR